MACANGLRWAGFPEAVTRPTWVMASWPLWLPGPYGFLVPRFIFARTPIIAHKAWIGLTYGPYGFLVLRLPGPYGFLVPQL
eukprot:12427996-Karenia_brevis.AAC.1